MKFFSEYLSLIFDRFIYYLIFVIFDVIWKEILEILESCDFSGWKHSCALKLVKEKILQGDANALLLTRESNS